MNRNQAHDVANADSEGGIDVAESGFDPSEFSDSPEPVAVPDGQ